MACANFSSLRSKFFIDSEMQQLKGNIKYIPNKAIAELTRTLFSAPFFFVYFIIP